MNKSTFQRQRLIANFIDSENVSSQNQLKGLLKKNQILITQATLSRDLNELGAIKKRLKNGRLVYVCLLYTSPSPRDRQKSRMPSSA